MRFLLVENVCEEQAMWWVQYVQKATATEANQKLKIKMQNCGDYQWLGFNYCRGNKTLCCWSPESRFFGFFYRAHRRQTGLYRYRPW